MQVQAVNVSEITGIEVSEDGQHALIRFRSGANEAVFAFPFEQLMPLMQTASTGFTMCLQVQNADPTTKHILPCEHYEIGPSPDFTQIIFTFRLPGGMEMSYPVPRRDAKNIRDHMDILSHEPGTFPMGKPQ